MTPAKCHEITRLEQRLNSAERELNHRAEIILTQVEEIARLRACVDQTRAELDDAARLGTQFATLLRFAGQPMTPDGLPDVLHRND